MATTTERIALEVRGQLTGADALRQAKKHLVDLIRLRDNFNKVGLDARMKGLGDLDKFQGKLRRLQDQLKAVGQGKLGDAIAGDVTQVDRAIAHARQQVKALSAEMAKLKGAQSTRPGADLGPRMGQVQSQIKAYEGILKQAGDLKSVMTPSAAKFAAMENQVGKAAAGSTKELGAQMDVLKAKSALFQQAKREADKFTQAEKQQATQARKSTIASKAAAGQLRETVRNGKLASQTFATGPGSTRTVSYGKKSVTTDRLDFEKRTRLEADALRARFAESKKGTNDQKQRLTLLQDEAREYENLAAKVRDQGRESTKLFQDLEGAAARARGEAKGLERKMADQTFARRKKIALDDAAAAQAQAISESSNRRTIVADDSRKVAQAYEREAAQLRDLQRQLKDVGLEGEKRFQLAGEAASKAETQAAALRRAIRLDEQERAQRATFGRQVQRDVDDAINQGFFKKEDRTVQNADGSQQRYVTLFKDENDLRTMRKAVIDLDAAGNVLGGRLETMERQLKAVGNRASWATRNFIDNTKTVVAWAASVVAYQAAFRAIEATTRAVIELQRSGAVLTAVFQGERAEAERLKTELLDLAVAQGRTGDEALDAGVRFARLGLTRKQILEAVTVSLKAANVAEIDAATAAEQLSSIMASFNLEVSQLYQVLTRLNNVSNQYNTTNKDLLQGIARVGNLAKETGLELEQLIAIIATGTGKTGRSGAEFGNAIKSIIVSLSNPEIQTKLDALFDIDVRNRAGEIKQMDNLLRDLAVSYQDLTGAEKQELLQIVGKKQQASRLAVILQNYTTIQKNLAASLRDGTATEAENADIRAILLSQLQSLRTAYEQLATSSTGAFNDGLVGRFASESIQFLTLLIQLLEKASGVFPIVAAAAGLFFFKFVRGAIALSRSRAETGLLINTLGKLGDVYRDLTLIMGMQERQLVRNNAVTRKLILKMRAAAIYGGQVKKVFANLGRALLFTVGSIARLATGFIALTAAFGVIIKLNDLWADYQQRQEEANRAALGFSTNLNEIADAAKRLEVLKDTAGYIRDVMDNASDSDLSRMIDDLLDIGKVGEDGFFTESDRDRINAMTSQGDRAGLEKELNRVFAESAERELAKLDEQMTTLTGDIAAQKKILEEAETARDNYTEGFFSFLGIGKSMAEINDEIAQGTDNLTRLGSELKAAQDKALGLRASIRDALVSKEDITASLQGFTGQSEALGRLIGGDGALGGAIAGSIKRALESAADADYLRGIEGEFDQRIGQMQNRMSAIGSDRAVAVFDARRTQLRGKLAEATRDFDQLSKAASNPVPVYGGASDSNRELAKLRDEAASRVAAAQAALRAYEQENVALADRSREARQLEADLANEEKRRAATVGTIQQETAAREKEREVLDRQQRAVLAYARRLQQLQRIQQDTAASTARYRFGRDETQRLDNLSTGITNDLAGSTARIRRLRELIDQAGNTNPALRDAAGQSLQEELIRASTLAQQLETTRNALVARRANLESEILEARIRQNEEASKALGLASREDQLRAAFLARYQQGNGGRRIDEGTFQFLDQQTRQAVNQFTPSQAPVSQGSELDRLQRERDRFQGFDRILTNLERSIDRVDQLLLDNAAAAGQAGLAPGTGGPGTPPQVNLNVAPGAVVLDISGPLSQLAVQLSEQVNARLDQEVAAIRDMTRTQLAALNRAAARGGG